MFNNCENFLKEFYFKVILFIVSIELDKFFIFGRFLYVNFFFMELDVLN